MTTHHYDAALTWDGHGTRDYATYTRQFRVTMPGKPTLVGSADPAFRGDRTRHSPEDLLLAAIASCHMLSYLALCARQGVDVHAYTDAAHGQMTGGRFEEVVLRPRVGIGPGDRALATSLHEVAHAQCYVARSCNFPIRCEPSVTIVDATAPVTPVRRDLAIALPAGPGGLATLGEALGGAGVSVEGGFVSDGVAHFLVANPEAAAAAGFTVLAVRDVVTVRLDQERPGQLGAIARAMADAGVTISCMYSDHDHQLILCADDLVAAERVARAWSA